MSIPTFIYLGGGFIGEKTLEDLNVEQINVSFTNKENRDLNKGMCFSHT